MAALAQIRRLEPRVLVGLSCLWSIATGFGAPVEVVREALGFSNDAAAGFRRVNPLERSLGFTNTLSRSARISNRILENGSGVALGDFNGDGRCDLFVARLEGDNVLALNQGDWRFKDVPQAGGAACPGQFSTGLLAADVDGDRDLDLVVAANDRALRLFLNTGSGEFEEVSDSGLDGQKGGGSIAAADVDGDGDLDLYASHYRGRTVKDENLALEMTRREGLWVVPAKYRDRFISTRNLAGRGILLEQGLADRLYRNDGAGRFSVVPWTDGFFRDEQGSTLEGPPLDWSLSAGFADVNDDGYPDLYVCSDFISPDRLWLNQGGNGFRAATRAVIGHTSWSSMCVDWADLDRDGDWDFFVGDMLSREHRRRHYQRANHTANAWTDWAFEQRRQYMRNTLYLNRGNKSFAELGRYAGLAATEWTWNCAWIDVDRDGWEDLLVTNGHPHDSLDSDAAVRLGQLTRDHPEARLELPSLKTPNLAFRHRGGLRFEERGAAWGFESRTHGQGLALGDLDGDGDRDLVVNPLNAPLEIYENIGTGPLVVVRLEDGRRGRTVCGAKVTLRSPRGSLMREIRCGGRYLSGDEGELTFGVGDLASSAHIDIRWPDGERSEGIPVKANTRLRVTRRAETELLETSVDPARPSSSAIAQGHFEDLSEGLAWAHSDQPFDDSKLQKSLDRQLSQLSIALGWGDLDRNGWDDLILGAGNEGAGALLLNERGEGWRDLSIREGLRFQGDQTAVCALGAGRFVLGLSGYERGDGRSRFGVFEGKNARSSLVDWYDLDIDTISALVSGDIDQDGDLDLFIGGRFQRGRYPLSAGSRIWLNQGGRFVPSTEQTESLGELGMVSAALLVHLDGDDWIDLVVAEEWGPLRGFLNREGRFVEATESLGLGRWTGLWQSLASGDLDGDGRMDLVAGNWGRNRFPRPQNGAPLRLFHGLHRESGAYLQVEGYAVPGLEGEGPVTSRDRLGEVLPGLASAFPRYRDYGSATVETILSPHVDRLRVETAAHLDSVVLLNRGAHFEGRALPDPVQYSPVMGMGVSDWDGDGDLDLVVSQNFYDTQLETAPYDAGLGLWLKGDGTGRFESLDDQASGIVVFGAGRGCAVGDFDRDGRSDLLVARHRRPPRLYRNRRAWPGLQVMLRGPRGNPAGIGARLRLRGAAGEGPVVAIQGGGGDGAQDSLSPVLGGVSDASHLWIKWPGGAETITAVAPGARRMVVGLEGEVVEISR